MDNQEAIETLKAKCATCKHSPVSKKWPCVDCDMREPADRWEAQEAKHSTESSLTQKGLDTISRTAAIEAVEFGITYAKAIDVNTGESKELFKEGNDALKKAVERIKDLSSAQPERKKGKWTKDCACEICGFKPWYERDIHTLSFCPNCGADMREDQTDDNRPG